MPTLRELREQWKFRGNKRPPFAIEPNAQQESVWDYPRPPVLVEDSRHVMIHNGENLLAESKESVRLLETAGAPCFYLAPHCVDFTQLNTNSKTTFCEWKGTATYFDLNSGAQSVAWTYCEPFTEFQAITNWLAFYPTVLDCTVNGEKVLPQPGGFYGGWVTKEIVGPFKGEPEVIDQKKPENG